MQSLVGDSVYSVRPSYVNHDFCACHTDHTGCHIVEGDTDSSLRNRETPTRYYGPTASID